MPRRRFMLSLSSIVLLVEMTTPPRAQADTPMEGTWTSITPGAPSESGATTQ